MYTKSSYPNVEIINGYKTNPLFNYIFGKLIIKKRLKYKIMIEYITRIEKHKYPIYKAERTIDNKKVVVICNPESKSVDIQFYRDNELLTKSTDFNNFEKLQLELFELTYMNIFRKSCTEQSVEIIAEICKRFLKYIKDTTINYINITGNIII